VHGALAGLESHELLDGFDKLLQSNDSMNSRSGASQFTHWGGPEKGL